MTSYLVVKTMRRSPGFFFTKYRVIMRYAKNCRNQRQDGKAYITGSNC